jgi:hypothetical protein
MRIEETAAESTMERGAKSTLAAASRDRRISGRSVARPVKIGRVDVSLLWSMAESGHPIEGGLCDNADLEFDSP